MINSAPILRLIEYALSTIDIWIINWILVSLERMRRWVLYYDFIDELLTVITPDCQWTSPVRSIMGLRVLS